MNDPSAVWNFSKHLLRAATAVATAALMAGCGRPAANVRQGYIEGEFVYVASPLAGRLDELKVQRGAQVKAGEALFRLESTSERAAFEEAERRLAQARASLEDAKKGKRPSELESIEAKMREEQAALELSEKDLKRQEILLRAPGATTEQEVDRARSTRDQNRQRLDQFRAELETARLGARPDQIAAEEANVRALEATLVRAEWDLSQKEQSAPQAGRVFDTLFREGEWVGAGRPIVSILPPAGVKLRVFVPQPWLGSIHTGDTVSVFIDGVSGPSPGRISFISPRAEFTPPVIYSREHRDKFVFMVEAVFEFDVAVQLHPGQPVDVQFNLAGKP
jgi:HlyD family secretion protein